MRIRFTISWKIGVGFGIFVVVTGILFFLTNGTLSEFRKINDRIDQELAPGLEELETLSREIGYSRTLLRHWATVQSREDNLEKTELKALLDVQIPQRLAGIESLSKEWPESDKARLDSLSHAIDQLFIVYAEVMHLLPDFESYDDPFSRMKVDYMMLPGEGFERTGVTVDRLTSALITSLRRRLANATGEMNALSDRLRFLAGNISVFVLVFGVIIAITVSRSIVRPVSELKRTLLYLGKGIYPRNTVKVTSDEIGDMAFAVNRLVDGLKKTREFSAKVGEGNFDAQYMPLSEDDELGYALLKMRDDLAANERLLERKVEERTNEVVQQKEEIERQKERVTELYKDLTDSINYAKRLQQTILPPREAILEMFPESFVLYRPRDIVSGDFYWFKTAGKKKMFAAVDCTGHGVPGAFMSLVGHNVLNQVTKVFTHPDHILNNLNRLAEEALRSEIDGQIQLSDGMDLALVVIDTDTLKMEYAGAYNPIYIIRRNELFQLAPDKFSIGSFQHGEKTYTKKEFQLESGDTIYAFSDGFVDQFGGPKNKKFLKKHFRELLMEISPLPMDQQQLKLNETLITWKKNLDQVDDILVIGVRV